MLTNVAVGLGAGDEKLVVVSERVFTVAGSAAIPAHPITLAEAGLRERSDLQEWVLAHPEIIGDGVLVVTFEFNRWQASRGSASATGWTCSACEPMAD